MPSPRDCFLFVHITKCGGSTFQHVLARAFRGGYYYQPTPIWQRPFSRAEVEKFLAEHQEVTCFAGHRLSLDLPFETPAANILALTLIREPVGRVLSHYFYHRNDLQCGYPETRELDLDAYMRYALVEGHESWLADGQYKYLTRGDPSLGMDGIERLVREGRFLPLPLARMEEVSLMLEAAYPQHFRDCSYVRQNASRKDQPVSAEVKTLIAEHMDLDRRLEKMAHTLLDERLAQLFPTDATKQRALRDFRRRCTVRRLVKEPTRIFFEKAGRVTSRW